MRHREIAVPPLDRQIANTFFISNVFFFFLWSKLPDLSPTASQGWCTGQIEIVTSTFPVSTKVIYNFLCGIGSLRTSFKLLLLLLLLFLNHYNIYICFFVCVHKRTNIIPRFWFLAQTTYIIDDNNVIFSHKMSSMLKAFYNHIIFVH